MDWEPSEALPQRESSQGPSKSLAGTPTDGDSSGADLHQQSIVEIADGPIQGQPLQPGPQYKRGRGRSFFKEPPRRGAVCQVPACDRSLHKLRDYYKRYKICPYHLELSCMVVEGQSIRFCQQCGRFQLLDEFDGDRRSCRRKLEKHNERRRKAEGGSDSEAEANGLRRVATRPNRSRGPGLLDRTFGAMDPVSQMLQNLAGDSDLTRALAPSMVAGLQGLASNNGWGPPPPQSLQGQQGQQAGGGFQLPPVPPPDQVHPSMLAVLAELAAYGNGQPPQVTSRPSFPMPHPESAGAGALQPPPNVLLQSQPVQPRPQRAVESPSRVLAALAQQAAPKVPSWPQQSVGAAGSAFSPLTLPSAAAPAGQGADGASASGTAPQDLKPPPELLTQEAPSDDSATLAALQQLAALTAPAPEPTPDAGVNGNGSGTAMQPSAIHQLAAAFGNDMGAANTMLGLLARLQAGPQAPSLPEDHVLTMSLKVFQATPNQLPPSLLKELCSWMAKTPTYIEVALRPGCVHVATSVLLNSHEGSRLTDGLESAIKRALMSTSLGSCVAGSVLAQLQCDGAPQAAIIRDGQLRMLLDLRNEDGLLRPRVQTLRPLAVPPGFVGEFTLCGTHLDVGSGDCIYARARSTHPAVEVVQSMPNWVRVRMPTLEEGGCQVEVQRGVFVSAPLGFAVLDDAAAVAEVRQLETNPAGVEDVHAFAHSVGLVVRKVKEAAGRPASLGDDEVAVRLAAVAHKVAAVCLLRGWPALLRLVLPAVRAGSGSAAEAMAAVEAHLGEQGCALRAAIIRGDPRLVTALGEWSRQVGHSWEGAWDPSKGLTPCHLTAMLPDPCPMAAALNELLPDAPQRWSQQAGPCAISALSVAAALRKEALLKMLAADRVPAATEALATLRKGLHKHHTPRPAAPSPATPPEHRPPCSALAHTTSPPAYKVAVGPGVACGPAPVPSLYPSPSSDRRRLPGWLLPLVLLAYQALLLVSTPRPSIVLDGVFMVTGMRTLASCVWLLCTAAWLRLSVGRCTPLFTCSCLAAMLMLPALCKQRTGCGMVWALVVAARGVVSSVCLPAAGLRVLQGGANGHGGGRGDSAALKKSA